MTEFLWLVALVTIGGALWHGIYAAVRAYRRRPKPAPIPVPVYWCVAGTFAQSEQERKQYGFNRRQWRYVSSAEAIRGYDIDPGLVIYTGTWATRPDMEAISRELLINSHKHAAKNSRLHGGRENR